MSNLIEALSATLGPEVVPALASQIGAPSDQTQSGIAAALPLLVGAMAHNGGNAAGAASLFGALGQHDGGLLGNVAGALLDPGHAQAGAGVLGHLLGGQRDHAAAGVGQASGLSSEQSTQLLVLLAPIVMGVLGKHVAQQGLDVGGLTSFLGGEKQSVDTQAPGLLAAFLDQHKDGNVADDALRIGAGLLGSFLRR
jgi:hypothetical protein